MSAVRGQITLGQMTMYVLLFRQGQAAVSASLAAISGMYEDNLYLSTLYEYLDTPVDAPSGTAIAGPGPGDGVRFEGVSFTYPGASEPAVSDVSFHLQPGHSLALVGENGSGQDHAHQAADAPVRAVRRAHHARRPRPRASGARPRCAAASR